MIVYTNAFIEVILRELQSGDQRWIGTRHFHKDSKELWFAHPSAVIGYDDSSPDLAIRLRTNAGPIEQTLYCTSTGGAAAPGLDRLLLPPIASRHFRTLRNNCSECPSPGEVLPLVLLHTDRHGRSGPW